jgi:hypothetical protein
MADRTHHDDFKDVMRAAEEAITHAMQDGQHKYDAGDWLKHSMQEHSAEQCVFGRSARKR